MAERSKRIILSDDIKLKEINKDTVKLFNKYIVDMNIRGLSDKSINGYKYDLNNWFIYVLDNQFNQCVTELNDEDITEFVYYCMQQGNNAKRIKRRMSSISAFYKYLRKKKNNKRKPNGLCFKTK